MAAVEPIKVPLEATITFDLDGLWPDPDRSNWDEEDGPPPVDNRYMLIDAVSKALADKLYQDLFPDYTKRREFEDNVKEAVKQRVLERVTSMLDEGVQIHNQFGKAETEVKPLIDFVTEAVEEWLNVKKDDRGYGPKRTELQKLVATQVDSVLRKELTETVTTAKARVRKIVAARAAAELAESMEGVAEALQEEEKKRAE